MVDPTSDLEEDVTEEDAPTCHSCGTPIVREADHRVVTWVQDGEVETRHFCDEGCRDEWDR
jgi:hypothetical protein